MATLVLTAVGTAIGGPIGGAIGATIGNQADQRLFGPRHRGARLGALTVQTSAYGQPIAKLFGTLRVAGTVIWATDLREDRHRSGGGKGQPKTTSYSYSASFAVALSARPIRAVHRIWADGKLLRGAAGDWKSETGFRLHVGDETQAVDPLLAAAEGPGGTPAYRGLAYAVFEDMQLADHGNRIPSLTFEIEADAAAVPLARIAEELSGGAITGETIATLSGYAAGGDSVRGAIEALARAIPMSLRDDGAHLRLSDAVAAARIVPAAELGGGAGGRRADHRSVDRQASGSLPDEVTVTYYEPTRDYQAGLQRARRGGPARRVEAIDLPAAMEAGQAKAVAERRLANGWAERTTAAATLPWRWLHLRPGDTVRLGDDPRRQIAQWSLEAMVLNLKLRGLAEAHPPLPHAEPGRAAPHNELPHGPTRIALLDLPPLDDGITVPQLWLAAAGPSLGWRRAAVTVSFDDGASWSDAGATALPATMGVAQTGLARGSPSVFDRAASMEVELLHDAMTLLTRDDDALAGGANLAMLGDELFQFGDAEPLGHRRWRLSRLLRGRRGTEAAIGHHAAGEPFVLIERDTLLLIAAPLDGIGGTMRVIVSGIADPIGVEAVAGISGRALRPPSPVHFGVGVREDGGLRFDWVRRSRVGWSWSDGGEVPIGEESERYRLSIQPETGAARTIELASPTFEYTPEMMAADGVSSRQILALSVVQLGLVASSSPATAICTSYGERL